MVFNLRWQNGYSLEGTNSALKVIASLLTGGWLLLKEKTVLSLLTLGRASHTLYQCRIFFFAAHLLKKRGRYFRHTVLSLSGAGDPFTLRGGHVYSNILRLSSL